ncbi:DnaD domain protein [Clostridium perfringens]|nr:DnaD domain protein [Clostridium perfringens]MDM0726035.1 DnaD domain protein [Clostridium perfringens]
METNRSGQFRKKKVYFTQVSNVALRDSKLSLKAKGLYALIQSYLTIEDFTLYKNTLKKHLKEGEKAFENSWKELKDAAYLIQYRMQDPKTKHFYYEYELLDAPDVELANKVHSSQNRKKHEEKSHTPKKLGMDKKDEKNKKAIPTKREGMDNGYNGKVGVHNNTNTNYTDLSNTMSNSSSTESIEDLYKLFEETFDKKPSSYMKNKLLKFINQTNFKFVAEVLLYCSEHNAKAPSYLFKTLENLINRNITTIKLFKESIEGHYKELESKKKSKKIKTKKDNKAPGANFTERDDYDYDKLEKDLLGW